MSPEPGGWHCGKIGASSFYCHAASAAGAGAVVSTNGLYRMVHMNPSSTCEYLEVTLDSRSIIMCATCGEELFYRERFLLRDLTVQFLADQLFVPAGLDPLQSVLEAEAFLQRLWTWDNAEPYLVPRPQEE